MSLATQRSPLQQSIVDLLQKEGSVTRRRVANALGIASASRLDGALFWLKEDGSIVVDGDRIKLTRSH